jgi:hypothetical protein
VFPGSWPPSCTVPGFAFSSAAPCG